MKKHIANGVTGLRIALSLLILLFPVSDAGFWIVYLICGFSDMTDGTIARKLHCVSDFGSKLDTFADFVFLTISCIKWLPTLNLPAWIWIWASIIACLKLSMLIRGWIHKQKGLLPHTFLNKATGLLMFCLPLTAAFINLKYSAALVCFVATLAAIQECFLHN